MNKTFKILEILWLIMGCVGVLLCSYFIVAQSKADSIFFLIFTFACGLMYAVRRRQRIKFEAAQKQKEEKK
jgi:asparagine N-glycosylation enzyme membrane subunit Stt3